MKRINTHIETKSHFLILSLTLLLLLFTVCKKQENIIEFKSFPDEYNLKGEKLNLIIYTHAVRFELLDSLLFTLNPYDEHFFISIYNKNTLQHIKSFCKRGKGPWEKVSSGNWSLDKDNGILWVSDFQKVNLWGYYIDSLLKFPDYTPTTIISLPKKLNPMMGVASFNSELFAVPDPFGEVQLFFFDKNGEQVSVMEKMDIKDTDDLFLSELTRTQNRIHPGKEKIVMVYRNFDRMIIRDLKSDNFIETIGPDHIDPKKQLALYEHERFDGYDGKPKFDEDYIYALYEGTIGTKVDFETGKMSAVYSKNIHIFDWDGNPVMKLILDHEVSAFVIDKENKRIIAFAVDAEDNIISYDISHIPELN